MAVILEPVLLRSRRTAIHGTTILLVQTLMAALLALPMFAQVKPTDEKVPCRNSKDVFALFDRLGYTPKAWQAGIREIPRVYLADIPDTRLDRSDLSVQDKNFLQIDSEIALTFASIALGASNQEKRRRTTQSARKAYDTIMRLREDTDLDDAGREKLDANLQRLKRELQSLEQKF